MSVNKSTNNDDKTKKIKQSYELDMQSMAAQADDISASTTNEKTDDNETTIIQYPVIKRMLRTLDRFLTKKFSWIFVCCIFAITACSVGLFINNARTSTAGSGSEGTGPNSADLALNTWLWAGIALFAFIAVFAFIYMFTRLRSKKTD